MTQSKDTRIVIRPRMDTSWYFVAELERSGYRMNGYFRGPRSEKAALAFLLSEHRDDPIKNVRLERGEP